jgi:acyl-CoA reductase-like NAD-dependent aldehyde dehydrogenase
MLAQIFTLAPNLALGNPVLAKHANIVPHCADVFEKLVLEAGAIVTTQFERGFFQVLTGLLSHRAASAL